ncbi:TonB-dependent receptor [Paremcibacter congregatus]|uniref:TonB-dependent receptor n=2 Tax=Paremcibacter congregatus TaxID=2043170 RepID=A0A2G4YQT2_9PROT|nr:TonB-dependent receptor [Paremcibacter congregatus]QDE29326.1 TonB-dependent receptor [Paremcibacter congregatus]
MISTPQLFKGLSVSALALASALTFTTAQAAEDSAMILEEIVVTAQKRSQNLQDVPSSVATLGGEKMDVLKGAGADIKFMSARVPSLYIETSFGRTFPRFYIRGLGNSDFDLNASQPVSLIYDEVVLENPILKGAPIFDMDRVEVLRGPQGTLFGRNTIAGIIKLESKKPTQETNGYVRASLGNFGAVELEAAAGGALVEDKLAVRISGMYQRQGDWVDNTLSSPEKDLEDFVEAAARLQLLLTPSDATSFLLNGHIRSMDGTATVFRANIIEPGRGGFIQNFSRERVHLDGRNEQALDAHGVNLKIVHDFDFMTFTSVTGYEHGKVFSRGDVDGGFGGVFDGQFPSGPGFIPFASESAGEIPGLDQWTQEIRFSSNDNEMINYQVGAFYFSEDLTINNYSYNSYTGGTQNGFAVQKQDIKAFALFGNIDVNATEDLKITAGLRYSDDKKDFTATRSQSPFGAPNVTVNNNTKEDNLSWDLSAIYTANEDINVFARVAKGFRAPSIQGRIVFGDASSVASSETAYSYEMGIKADVLEGRGRVNATTYYYNVNDMQLTAVGGTSNVTKLINADKVEGYGFEADMEFLVTDNLATTLGLSYNKTQIKDNALFIVPGGSGPTTLDPTGPSIPGPFGPQATVSLDGNPLPNSPEWVLNFTARYSVPVEGGEFFAYTDWAYRSSINFFLYESVEFKDNFLLEGGLKAGYVHGDNEWQVALYVRNITNDLSLTGAIDFNNFTGFVNEPRKWGIEAKYNF